MRSIIDIWRKLNLSCRDMTALVSRAMDERLPFWDRFACKLHLCYCRACRQYTRHLRLLREALHQSPDELDAELEHADGLSDDARERIREALRKP